MRYNINVSLLFDRVIFTHDIMRCIIDRWRCVSLRIIDRWSTIWSVLVKSWPTCARPKLARQCAKTSTKLLTSTTAWSIVFARSSISWMERYAATRLMWVFSIAIIEGPYLPLECWKLVRCIRHHRGLMITSLIFKMVNRFASRYRVQSSEQLTARQLWFKMCYVLFKIICRWYNIMYLTSLSISTSKGTRKPPSSII